MIASWVHGNLFKSYCFWISLSKLLLLMLIFRSNCLEKMDTSSSALDSFSSSDNDEEQAFLILQLAMQNTMEFIHSNKWEEARHESVNPLEGVCYILGSMMSTPGLFKVLTNFSIPELCQLVCLTIVAHILHVLRVLSVSSQGIHLN